jgi:hypothetical protein
VGYGSKEGTGPVALGAIPGRTVALGPDRHLLHGTRLHVHAHSFFDFLACFFSPDPGACGADFNGDTTVNSQDFFDFLDCFFNGC